MRHSLKKSEIYNHISQPPKWRQDKRRILTVFSHCYWLIHAKGLFLPFLFFSFTHSTRQQEINYSCTIIIFFSLCLDKKQFPLRISGKCFSCSNVTKAFPLSWLALLFITKKEIFRVVGSFFLLFFRVFSLLPVWVAYFVALTVHVYLCVCQFVCML